MNRYIFAYMWILMLSVNDNQTTIHRTTEVRDRVNDWWGTDIAPLERKTEQIVMDRWGFWNVKIKCRERKKSIWERILGKS